MPSSPRRSGRTRARAAAVAAGSALLAAAALAGCSTGFEAETVQVYNAPAGIDLRSSDVDVLGALVVADRRGNGTLVAGMIPSQDTADELTGIEVSDADGNSFAATIAGGTLPLPTDDLVQTAEGATVTITGEGLTPGRWLEVVFTFERGGPISGQLPVVPRSGAYAEVPMAPPEVPTGAGAAADNR